MGRRYPLRLHFRWRDTRYCLLLCLGLYFRRHADPLPEAVLRRVLRLRVYLRLFWRGEAADLKTF